MIDSYCLSFIKQEDFEKHVAATIATYNKALESINLKKFNNLTEVFAWQRDGVFNLDNSWYNGPTENGMIVSPYLTLKVNGKEFPVYSARATFSTHSFAYAEVESEGEFSLNVELHLNQKRNVVDVLPENKGIKATMQGDFNVITTINQTGSFSFVFDHYTEGAFTLMVRRKLPFAIPEGYQVEEYPNTAIAAKMVAEKNDPTIACIAAIDTAEIYNLKVIESNINASRNNTTRFAAFSRVQNLPTPTAKMGEHFILVFTVLNEAGSLAKTLNIIGSHGFNMRNLRSRPMKTLMWNYYFYIELDGNINTEDGKDMLRQLSTVCDRLKLVGTYSTKL